MVLADLGLAEEALEAVGQARRAAAATHHPELTIRAEISALYLETATGRPGESLAQCEAALRHSPTSHLLAMQALAAIGAARADLGDDTRAEEAARACYDTAATDGAPYESFLATHLLGRVEILRGRWDRSVTLLSEASEGFSRLRARLEQGRVLLRLAEAQGAEGHDGDARATLAAALHTLTMCGAVSDLRRGQEIGARLGVPVQP